MKRLAILALAAVLAAGCASRRAAPVVDRGPEVAPPPVVEAPKPAPEPPPVEKPLPTHVVKPKETLVGIALQYGLDYRELAAWNNITNPNALRVGQVLIVGRPPEYKPAAPVATPLASAGSPPIEARPLANTPTLKVEPRGQKLPYSDRALAQLGSPDGSAAVNPAPTAPGPVAVPQPPANPTPPPAEPERGTEREAVDWSWPVKGKVIAPFSEASKGIDIAGRKGASVQAAAAGRVIYAGDLRAYGKLVILKHNETWVSAYAHNDRIVVKEGDDVKRGQKIAEMGSTDTDQVKLHFEVRRQGKPVDPSRVLPAP